MQLKSSIIYCWTFGHWLNIPLASTCLLTCSPIWVTGQYACGSRRSIKSLTKHSIINYTAFSCNNIPKFFYYQILTDRFVLNLKSEKNWRCHFSFWYSIIGLIWSHKILPGTLVRIPIWILPVVGQSFIQLTTTDFDWIWHLCTAWPLWKLLFLLKIKFDFCVR